MEVVLVPTTHWDREWYRTFQAFRARLVDTVDRVLDLIDADPGYRFLLDGQSIVCEDYVAVRPQNRNRLERAIRDGRIAIGPWYVQPDSLLPGGEAHVRNLLEGRRAGEEFGPVSRIAYTPDSFGHPSQFPQMFAGFGLTSFVYWRGNAGEITDLPAEYRWRAPDGSEIVACHLWRGYFNAAGLSGDLDEAVRHLHEACEDLASRTRLDRVLLLAGADHELPEARTAELSEALAARTGWNVRQGLLEDFVPPPDIEAPSFTGELVGGRIANLLPGVWSTRTYLKVLNRTCETALDGQAEPWAALGGWLGAPDERPALREAWRELLRNQAHDSICGCSQDAVHDQMLARYAASVELADQTTRRVCERIAGLGPERRVPWSDALDLAVFNPSPHERTDVVRFALDPIPPWRPTGEVGHRIHPLLMANLRPRGFTVDGRPARLVPSGTTDRLRLIPEQDDWEVEFTATVPPFGWTRVRLEPTEEEHPEATDDGRRISVDGLSVEATDDATFTVSFGERTYRGLAGLEDTGDRGDTYDYDPVAGDVWMEHAGITRRVHPNGICELETVRRLAVPALGPDRARRSGEAAPVTVTTTARLAPGVRRVEVRCVLDNRAPDHRLRLLFPTGRGVETFTAATTFGVAERTPGPQDATHWRHPAPATFCHQGWIHANGLTVAAFGLPEGEVTPDGTIAITLLRAVGWLSRPDLATRPDPAGPALPTPGAQCVGRRIEARLVLMDTPDARSIRDAEVGLMATAAGDTPLVGDGLPLLRLEPRTLVLSALKPAEWGPGFVLRVLNPTDEDHQAVVDLGIDVEEVEAVRLDETSSSDPVTLEGRTVRFAVPARALRSIRMR